MSQEDIKEIIEAFVKPTIDRILDRFGRGKEERKKVDKKLYEEMTKIISPEFMRDFFYQLSYNQLWSRHSDGLSKYIYYTSTPGKKFLDKKIQKKWEAFNNRLGELWEFLLTDFFTSNHNEELALFQPELRKKHNAESYSYYSELSQKLSTLQKDTESNYESFILIAKKRLHVQ